MVNPPLTPPSLTIFPLLWSLHRHHARTSALLVDGLEKILAAAALSCDVVELTAAVMVRMEESAAVRVSEQIRSASPNHNQIQ